MTFNTELWNGQAPGAAGGYEIERSLRFNSGDSSFLSRTPSSAGNLTTFTIAGWVKRTKFGSYDPILLSADTSQTTEVAFTTNNEIQFVDGPVVYRKTNAVFRDPSAWYHVVVVWDSTNATDAHRCRIYVNGVEQSYQTNPSITSGTTTDINTTDIHYINRQASTYGNCYHADVHFIDGQALDPTSFGEFDDNGVWQPIEYTGSYPGNSFYLDFADNSSTTSGSNVGIGKDVSDNGNYWDSTNISIGASYIAGSTLATPINAFDGSTSTSTLIDTTTRVLTNQSISVSSQFEIYTNNFNLQTIRLISGGNTYQFQNHPTNNYTVLNNADSQNNTPFTGTLTGPISIVRSAGSAAFYAVRVDGTVLVDDPAGNDSLLDSPQNADTTTTEDTGVGGEIKGNYCTLNPLHKYGTLSFSNGNLDVSASADSFWVLGTVGVSTGKWYWEGQLTSGSAVHFGISESSFNNYTGQRPHQTTSGYTYLQATGRKYHNSTVADYGDSYAIGDVIGIALDMDAGTLVFYKNGTSQGTAFSGLSGTFTPCFSDTGTAGGATLNFGQRAFVYAAPSGFKSLNTANLPTPTIEEPSNYVGIVTYTGNGTTQTIPGLDFNPDFVWIKSRSDAFAHVLQDSVRGFGSTTLLSSNESEKENTATTPTDGAERGYISQTTSTGFTVVNGSSSLEQVNGDTHTYVAWAWKAGGAPTTDNVAGAGNVPTAGSAKIDGANMTTTLAGSIPATRLSANTTAGFSIVTWTSSSSVSTVAHGLDTAPYLIITKNRSVSNTWWTYHESIGNTKALRLDTFDGATTISSTWDNTSPSPSVFTVGGEWGAGNNIVAYCFAPIEGYSAFGSYSGTGNTNQFIHTGFRPRYIIIKSSYASDSNYHNNWPIWDTKRNQYNEAELIIDARTATAEFSGTHTGIDIVSNGFGLKPDTGAYSNYAGVDYVWAAFADDPFRSARAR